MCTAPPRTPMFEMLAPRAVQFVKLQDEMAIKETFDNPDSMHKAPPLLKDGNPVVPLATVTTLDANVDLLTLKLASAVLLAYIAPPPPFASPRRPDSALENTEHSENTDIEITIVRFAPVEMRGLFRVIDNPVLKLEIWCE